MRHKGRVCLLTQKSQLGPGVQSGEFSYCYEADGQLAAILAEVTNTPWRERYHYVLPARAPGPGRFPSAFRRDKAFHVSPFLPAISNIA